jgi:crotonobetainyl-CoA:carnitine CoA-transferase CaiB-like acyl-CoA transferase
MSDGALPALDGLNVVEFAHVIAGPLAGTLLADLGATVVHVEPPGSGDAGRDMGPTKDGVPLWWKVSARNKRSVSLDLRQERGRELARRLAAWADVVITSLRVDRLRAWGLDWTALHEVNPRLVMLQVSGFGANSSLANAPGFGKVGEARSGVVALTGFPDGPPVHTGFSHGDSVTALTGAFGVLAALWRRERDPDFAGEWIDLALFEGLFRLIEWQLIVADQLGIVPQRSGNRLAIAPGAAVNTFMTRDGEWITVTSATQRSVRNIVSLVGLDAADYQTAAAQRERADLLDEALREWVAERSADECLRTMADAEVVASRIFTAEDILADAVYREREDIVTVEDEDLGPVRMQAVVPRMERHGGNVWRTGPALGADNDLVYGDWLGLAAEELEELKRCGTI